MDDVLSHDSEDEDEDEDEDDDYPSSEVEATNLDLAVDTTGPNARRLNNQPTSVVIPQIPAGLRDRLGHSWAFWHGFGPSGERLVASGRLEKKGPFGDDSIQTSNRAELRAVIAALRFRFWPGEGFHTLVVATDSEYVVEGSTNWAKTWVENGWTKRGGAGVKNKDLWEALLGEIERYKDEGMAVEFWRIPRVWNTVADIAAKEAAAEVDVPNQWAEVMGINC
ncbi:Ribonuclease H [Madurella mycetomatis]|uniref:ribonuclease H n=1 Tax=Madurella mycetomatis TaxID=100816 RepID=A0A175W4F5_9PEZI|nr:Ribonuclease H [Madurella mycetomatis]